VPGEPQPGIAIGCARTVPNRHAGRSSRFAMGGVVEGWDRERASGRTKSSMARSNRGGRRRTGADLRGGVGRTGAGCHGSGWYEWFARRKTSASRHVRSLAAPPRGGVITVGECACRGCQVHKRSGPHWRQWGVELRIAQWHSRIAMTNTRGRAAGDQRSARIRAWMRRRGACLCAA